MSSRKTQARTVGASYKTKLLIRRNAKQARAMLDLNELLLAGGRVSFISTNTRKHIIQSIAARGDDEEVHSRQPAGGAGEKQWNAA